LKIEDLTPPFAPYREFYPVYSGSEYAVAWRDRRDRIYEVYFTTMSDFDSDGDGLLDNEEPALAGTQPDNWDTDDDGMDDSWEAQSMWCGLDPLTEDDLEDADSDGEINIDEYVNGNDPCENYDDGDDPCDNCNGEARGCTMSVTGSVEGHVSYMLFLLVPFGVFMVTRTFRKKTTQV
jgi:hypothetical protein